MSEENAKPIGPQNSRASSNSQNGSRDQKDKPSLTIESLEPRILLSATWADSNDDEHHDDSHDESHDDHDDDHDDDRHDDDDDRHDDDDERQDDHDSERQDDSDDDHILRATATEGDDLFAGADGSDYIDGLGGDDRLSGGQGDDRLHGDAGNDDISGGSGDDTLDGGAGKDTIHGDSGKDDIAGGDGDDQVWGDSGDDELHGGHGNDVMDGGTGKDRIDGGGGNDVLLGGNGNDVVSFDDAHAGDIYQVSGGNGTDTIDLHDVHSSHADMSLGRIDVHTDDDGRFTIHHSQVEKIQFADQTIAADSHSTDAAMYSAAERDMHEQPDDSGPSDPDDGGHAGNDAPTADAGHDLTVAENALVQLHGGGGDAEGQNLSYEWVQTSGPAVTLDDPHAASPSFTAPEDLSNTDIGFELHVSDGTSTSVDSVTVHVNADNDAPTADAGHDLTVAENALVQLHGGGGDAEDQNLSYEWVQTSGPAVTLDDPHAASPSFTAPEGLSNTDIGLELHVTDGTNVSVDSVTVHVNADNDAPTADAGHDLAVAENALVQLHGGGGDAEGQNLSYEWVQTSGPAVTLDDPHAASPSFTAPEGLSNTDIGFELHVTDGTNVSVDSVTVHVNADNDAPTADAGHDLTVAENALVQLHGGGGDAEGQNLSYEWVQASGPAARPSEVPAPNQAFAAPSVESDSEIKPDLRVTDGASASVDAAPVQVRSSHEIAASPASSFAPSESHFADADGAPAAAVGIQESEPASATPTLTEPAAQDDGAASAGNSATAPRTQEAAAEQALPTASTASTLSRASTWNEGDQTEVLDASADYQPDADLVEHRQFELPAADASNPAEAVLGTAATQFVEGSRFQADPAESPAIDIDLGKTGLSVRDLFSSSRTITHDDDGYATHDADDSAGGGLSLEPAAHHHLAESAVAGRPLIAVETQAAASAGEGPTEEAASAGRSNSGWFVELWGMLRGWAGTKTDEQTEKSRR